MAKVYISYRATDRPLAHEITSRLRGLGHQVVIDTDEVGPGQEWRAVLRDALENSDCVVVLVTPDSQSSHFVLGE